MSALEYSKDSILLQQKRETVILVGYGSSTQLQTSRVSPRFVMCVWGVAKHVPMCKNIVIRVALQYSNIGIHVASLSLF